MRLTFKFNIEIEKENTYGEKLNYTPEEVFDDVKTYLDEIQNMFYFKIKDFKRIKGDE